MKTFLATSSGKMMLENLQPSGVNKHSFPIPNLSNYNTGDLRFGEMISKRFIIMDECMNDIKYISTHK